MAKKKATVQEEQFEEEVFAPVSKEEMTKATEEFKKETNAKIEKYLGIFKVKTSATDIKLRKIPSIKEDVIVGRMEANKTYRVLEVITYTPVKMYKLDNNYYVIADPRIEKINL